MPQLILTAIGNDRPGLVGELTGGLHARNANILETRMVNLRGQFAVITLLDAPDPASINDALPTLAKTTGLTFSIAQQPPAPRPLTGLPFKLKTYSLDQPGLVHRISEVLRLHNINIEDLSASQQSTPFAGDPLFIMEMRLTLPPAVQVKKLRHDLDAVCETLNCDLDLDPA